MWSDVESDWCSCLSVDCLLRLPSAQHIVDKHIAEEAERHEEEDGEEESSKWNMARLEWMSVGVSCVAERGDST